MMEGELPTGGVRSAPVDRTVAERAGGHVALAASDGPDRRDTADVTSRCEDAPPTSPWTGAAPAPRGRERRVAGGPSGPTSAGGLAPAPWACRGKRDWRGREPPVVGANRRDEPGESRPVRGPDHRSRFSMGAVRPHETSG